MSSKIPRGKQEQEEENQRNEKKHITLGNSPHQEVSPVLRGSRKGRIVEEGSQ